MKFRESFVTNSSSTSFILAIKGGRENIINFLEVDEKWKAILNAKIQDVFDYVGDDCLEKPVEILEPSVFKGWGVESAFAYKAAGYEIYKKDIDSNNSIARETIGKIIDNQNVILLSKDHC
jgi:hypothetical protein